MTVDGPRVAQTLVGQEVHFEGTEGLPGAVSPLVPNQELYRIATDRGYAICCAGSHHLYRSDGKSAQWVPAHGLDVGDELVLARHPSCQVDQANPTFVEGWIIGHIKGNGGHNPHKSGGTYVRFWDDETELIDRAVGFAWRLGARRDFRGSRSPKGITTVKTVGLETFAGQFLTAGSKGIKRSLIEASGLLVAGFIQGFFDADGSVQGDTTKGRSVRLNQSNYHDLRIVQQMLLRFEIASTIYHRTPAREKFMPDGRGGNKPYATKENWELVIANDNIERFARTISLSKPAHLAKLNALQSSMKRMPNRDRFLTKVTSVVRVEDGPVLICRVSDGRPYNADGFYSLDIEPRQRQP